MTGIIFDLDGTLLDTLEDLLDATNYALKVHGFPPVTLPRLRRFVGNGAKNQIRLSVPEGVDEETVEAETQEPTTGDPPDDDDEDDDEGLSNPDIFNGDDWFTD